MNEIRSLVKQSRLTYIGRHSRDKGGHIFGLYVCACGPNEQTICVIREDSVKSGDTRSCRCLLREKNTNWAKQLGKRNRGRGHGGYKHGHTQNRGGIITVSPTYVSWRGMIRRCTNPNDEVNWPHYGGRGITVCNRWLYGEAGMVGFKCFLKDMGQRPEGMTLDRYPDNDGNYEPDNCRWATPKQQAANRRDPWIARRVNQRSA